MTTNAVKIPVHSGLVAVYFASLLLLLGLGSWQVMRGLEKAELESMIAEHGETAEQLDRKPANWQSLAYRNVVGEGVWLDQWFLLDNRIHQGRAGYELFVPLLLQDKAVVMVNLGWLPKDGLEESLPAAEALDGLLPVSGQLYLPQKGFTLGPPSNDDQSWPRIIQYLEFAYLGDALGIKVAPAVIVTEFPELGTIKIWRPLVMDSKRHYGYALQWWGLALVLVVFGCIWYKRARDNGPND